MSKRVKDTNVKAKDASAKSSKELQLKADNHNVSTSGGTSQKDEDLAAKPTVAKALEGNPLSKETSANDAIAATAIDGAASDSAESIKEAPAKLAKKGDYTTRDVEMETRSPLTDSEGEAEAAPVPTPTPTADPSNADIMRMLEQLNSNWSMQFNAIRTEVRDQSEHVEGLSSAMSELRVNLDQHKHTANKRMDDMEKLVKAQHREFENELKVLRASPQPPPWRAAATAFPPAVVSAAAAADAGPSSSSAAPSSSAAAPRGPAARRRQGSAPPPAATPSSTSSPTTSSRSKVLALGFPRRLPRPALVAHWASVRRALPDDITENTHISAGSATMYSVTFPSPLHASKFLQLVRTLPKDATAWEDPRNPDETRSINFKADKTPQQQVHGRAFAPFYLKVKEFLSKASNFKEGMGLQVDTARGTLQVISRHDLWELAQVELINDITAINLNKGNLDYFSIPHDVFQASADDQA